MSVAVRRLRVLALVGLVMLALTAGPVRAQFRSGGRPTGAALTINPNFVMPNGITFPQAAFNTAVIGRAASNIPPYLLGYNPYPPVNIGPSYPVINPVNPYALSTLGGYGGGYGAGLATDPYASSYGLGGYGGYGGYGGAGGYGYGYPPYGGTALSSDLYAYGGYLRGAASLTAATGQYWKDIQTARIDREKARQASYETQRKRIMDEAAYERMRLTSQDVRDRDLERALISARRDPPFTDIWSGKALNDLLRSVGNSDKLNRGPNIPLTDDTLKNINLTTQASRGNLGLLKEGGKLAWPLPLTDAQYAEPRKKLDRNLRLVVDQLKEKDPIEPASLRDIRAEFRTISDRLAASVSELSPSQYIESRRFLNQLDDAIKALEDPNASKYMNLKARGANVSELLGNLLNDGYRFAPVTPGEESTYTALYHAIRAFEASLQNAGKGS